MTEKIITDLEGSLRNFEAACASGRIGTHDAYAEVVYAIERAEEAGGVDVGPCRRKLIELANEYLDRQ
ncbi:MAG: hypothetical protein CMH64_03370 [Nanoarchaeota archaeon]|nr:hypothetical protein [Nanoarchaeota archaeon]|tara:strand:+ start:1043 stop:1246 length:204 start_codon:yes stop_codon:yes gene_type:complete